MASLNLDTYLPYRLSVASNKISALIARTYEARFGLSIPQWRLLIVLSDGTALSQKSVVARTAMDKVTISRAVSTMVARGLVQRTDGATDRRHDVLCLSPAGAAIVAEVAPLAIELEAALIQAIGQDGATQLDGLLRTLEAKANQLSD
jgi:DNA-binding MarR family transcriptional regulator